MLILGAGDRACKALKGTYFTLFPQSTSLLQLQRPAGAWNACRKPCSLLRRRVCHSNAQCGQEPRLPASSSSPNARGNPCRMSWSAAALFACLLLCRRGSSAPAAAGLVLCTLTVWGGTLSTCPGGLAEEVGLALAPAVTWN